MGEQVGGFPGCVPGAFQTRAYPIRAYPVSDTACWVAKSKIFNSLTNAFAQIPHNSTRSPRAAAGPETDGRKPPFKDHIPKIKAHQTLLNGEPPYYTLEISTPKIDEGK